jgi:hypothetical protein
MLVIRYRRLPAIYRSNPAQDRLRKPADGPAEAAMISAADAARTYLAGAGQRPDSHLPPSVMVREIAELRRLLGQLLAEIDGLEKAGQP